MIALSKCPVGGTQLRVNGLPRYFGCVAAAQFSRERAATTQPVSSIYLQTTCCVPPTGHLHVAIIEMRRCRIIGGSAADFTSGRLLNISTGFCSWPFITMRPFCSCPFLTFCDRAKIKKELNHCDLALSLCCLGRIRYYE